MSAFSAGPASADIISNGHNVGGSILNEYNALIAIGRPAGNAESDETDDRGGGKFQKFQGNNNIYWHARIDPNRGRQIGGAIFDAWAATDYEVGPLKYPTERETDVTRQGKLNRFEGGVIYWSPSTGAHPVWGIILENWAAEGYEQSQYGFPIGNEEDWGAGKRQLFENGQYMEWQPEGFPVDWEGDDTNYVPTCGSGCAEDATIALGGPQISPPAGLFRSTEGDDRQAFAANDLEADEGTSFCDELPGVPEPDAPAGSGIMCIDRYDNFAETHPEAMIMPTTESTTPSATQSPSATPSTESTPAETTTPSTQTPSTTGPGQTTTSAPTTTTDPETACATTTTASSPNDEETEEPLLCGDASTSTTATPTQGGADNFLGDRRGAPKRALVPTEPKNPAFCQFGGTDFRYNDWMGDRMFQCRIRVLPLVFLDRQTFTMAGTIRIEEKRRIQLAWNNTAWDEVISVRVQSIEPTNVQYAAALEATQITWKHSCVCYSDGGYDQIGPMPASTMQVGFTTLDRKGMIAPGGSYVTGTDNWSFKSTAPKFTDGGGITGSPPKIRCDAAVGLRNTQGCSFYQLAPTLNYAGDSSLSSYNNHVRQAQDTALPGYKGNNAGALHRTTSQPTIKANRAATCGKITGGRPAGTSCDEYPFASTGEGGASAASQPNSGRTYPGCGIKVVGTTARGWPGYSVCMIPKEQNSRAGSLAGWFYAKQRIMDGDAFWVNVR
ncbi:MULTISPECIES: hypothetical protein [unclassified Rhodococcus (in: high G+C Gram-positive bacteria)]|uniref:NucA/NucB deoxyribonuclease domain-containing protein n=1 Tax=unclassified Rhodococcus (in: high G+C Gram-positive bacteria) TaxID=192944 RepID=UPI0015E8A728|nr:MULTISPECIES: hypothetical protein [unclassified Rhodococcus (in: high G+C Gram-positive bacteria)]